MATDDLPWWCATRTSSRLCGQKPYCRKPHDWRKQPAMISSPRQYLINIARDSSGVESSRPQFLALLDWRRPLARTHTIRAENCLPVFSSPSQFFLAIFPPQQLWLLTALTWMKSSSEGSHTELLETLLNFSINSGPHIPGQNRATWATRARSKPTPCCFLGPKQCLDFEWMIL